MTYRNLFPTMTGDDIHGRVSQFWNLEHKLPYPRYPLTCGMCGEVNTQHARFWQGMRRPTGGRVAHRINVSVKCTVCSAVASFGVPVTYTYWRQFGGAVTYSFREALQIQPLEQHEEAEDVEEADTGDGDGLA